MASPSVRPLGVALDDDPLFRELIAATRSAATDLGLETVDVRGPTDELDVDRTLVIGRPSRHTALLSVDGVVPRIVWSGEPLPAGPWHRRTVTAAAGDQGVPRSAPGRGSRLVRGLPLVGPPAAWRAGILADRLVRTNLIELDWAAEHGAELVVTSFDRAAILARHGLMSRVVPFGYHPSLAGALVAPDDGPRDIALLTLGAASPHLRRGRLLDRLAADADGLPVTRLDGAWGDDRTAALRRGRVLIDVHRVPGTFIGVRLVLALAAGMAVVTEPMADSRPFVPGVTHMEVPTDRLLAEARALASDEPRRQGLVRAGQALLADRLLLTRSLATILGAPGAGRDGTTPRSATPGPARAGTSGSPR